MAIQTENLITLAEAANVVNRRMPKGKKITVSKVRRWAKNGVRKHRLETQQIGLEHFTSLEALQRFFSRHVGDGFAPQPTPVVVVRAGQRQPNAAERLKEILGTE